MEDRPGGLSYWLCQRLSTTFTRPKPPMAMPATRFIQRMAPPVILPRKRFAALTRMVHQVIDPQNIPATRDDVCHGSRCFPRPSMASTARKESTVVGLVKVRKRVETKSELAWELTGTASSVFGGLQ